MELKGKSGSSPLGSDLISDMGISVGRRHPGSVFKRTCVDDIETVGCIDDGGPLGLGPDCTFETQRLARMIISVAAMPCVILKNN